ncbi:MAG: type II toxin-antitoxin system HicA family toxin [Hyphomicrobiaceae bacterium]
MPWNSSVSAGCLSKHEPRAAFDRGSGDRKAATRGFDVIRIRGSHHRLAHSDGRSTTVPVHGAEIIGPGLLSRIQKDADLSREDFEALG